jgi:hypothetical protein
MLKFLYNCSFLSHRFLVQPPYSFFLCLFQIHSNLYLLCLLIEETVFQMQYNSYLSLLWYFVNKTLLVSLGSIEVCYKINFQLINLFNSIYFCFLKKKEDWMVKLGIPMVWRILGISPPEESIVRLQCLLEHQTSQNVHLLSIRAMSTPKLFFER